MVEVNLCTISEGENPTIKYVQVTMDVPERIKINGNRIGREEYLHKERAIYPLRIHFFTYKQTLLEKGYDFTHSCAFQSHREHENRLTFRSRSAKRYVAHETNQLSMVGWPVCSILLIMSIPNAESEELNKASQY